MRWPWRREKIEIKVSKLLMHMAMMDAEAIAIQTELHRQVCEQLKGTWLEGSRITVDYGFAEHDSVTSPEETAARLARWPERPAPDSHDLTFTWVD